MIYAAFITIKKRRDMRHLRIIDGKKPGLSTTELIATLMTQLDHDNKNNCLECIMQLEPEQRTPFLNHYLKLIVLLPEASTADECIDCVDKAGSY